jgi:hypothetical protein
MNFNPTLFAKQATEHLRELNAPTSKTEDLRWFPIAKIKPFLQNTPKQTISKNDTIEPTENSESHQELAEVISHTSLTTKDYVDAYTLAYGDYTAPVHMPQEHAIKVPLQGNDFSGQVHSLSVGDQNASLAIHFEGTEFTGFTAQKVFIYVPPNAQLSVLVTFAATALLQSGVCWLDIHVVQAKGSSSQITFAEGATGLLRTKLRVDLTQPTASCDIRGLTMLHQNAQLHRYLDIRHLAPNCTSKQLFRSVLAHQSRSSLDGEVQVMKDCAGTQSDQLINSILLSNQARMQAKPVLLIYNDDVECTHGCTTGQLDPDGLFFLQSRGISKAQAQQILIQGFAAQALELLPEAQSKAILQTQLPTVFS